jgi:hypothetical protein
MNQTKMTRWVTLVAAMWCASSVFGQRPLPTELRVSGSRVLSVSTFATFDRAQCDAGGNLYYRPVAGSLNDSNTVVRIDAHGETTTTYSLPSELNGKAPLMNFNVTRSGRVWFLNQLPSIEYVVLGLGADGKVDSRIPLNTPDKMFPTAFRVADDGIILVAGYYVETASKKLQGKPYLALFDRDGNVRKTLGSPDLDTIDLAAAAKGPTDAGIASGSDGNFYVVQRDRILVISEWGNVIGHLTFVKPEEGLIAQRLLYGDGFLSLELDAIGQDHAVHPEFLVLYSATGATYAWYKLSEELVKSNPACFYGRSGYVFTTAEHHKFKLLAVPLR